MTGTRKGIHGVGGRGGRERRQEEGKGAGRLKDRLGWKGRNYLRIKKSDDRKDETWRKKRKDRRDAY